jgi:hypothetical protein
MQCWSMVVKQNSCCSARRYGLAAYFFTGDLARAWRVAEALEFGELERSAWNKSRELVSGRDLKAVFLMETIPQNAT